MKLSIITDEQTNNSEVIWDMYIDICTRSDVVVNKMKNGKFQIIKNRYGKNGRRFSDKTKLLNYITKLL